MPARLPVIVVHRDQPHRCVRTVRAFLAQDVPVRAVVVDNGSSPGACLHIGRELPGVEVVALGSNAGFGPAANVGLRRWLARDTSEWAAIAPHDALPEPGCLARLLDAASARPRAGLASATFGDPTKPVVDHYLGGILVAAGHPHGTLMLVRRACLQEVGLFDERYFAYCEEADLGVRAARAGWEVGVVWHARVRNPSLSVSVPVVEYLKLRNTLLLVREHFGRYPASIRLTMALVDTAVGAVVRSGRPDPFPASARLRAIADFGRGRFGPPPPSLVAPPA